MKKKIYKITALLLATALMVMGCGSAKSGKENSDSTNSSAQTSSDNSDSKKAPQIDGLTYESAMDLTYAQEFDVFYYKDGYKLIDVHEGRQYLIVPEGKEAPEGLDSDIVVINQPVQNIYMAATAIMSLFDALDAIQKETGKLPLVLHGGTGIPEDIFWFRGFRLVYRKCEESNGIRSHNICRKIQ